VPRQFLSAFGPQQPFKKGSGRLELAQAIIDPCNPLTARVMVNRIWQHHFGRGLVSTPSDFGRQGSPPSHLELLDWLAAEFIHSGWSMKHIHRLIMMSEAYKRRSDGVMENGRDGQNSNTPLLQHSYARFTPHRLSFEEARDAWLAAAGRLDLRLGGRPQPLFASDNKRRTLYALVDRENLPAVMRTFDFANPDLSIPQRNETTVPQQALFGMNHPFVVEQARALDLSLATIKSPQAKIRQIYTRLFQREPTAEEQALALLFVRQEAPASDTSDRSNAWTYGVGEWDDKTGRVVHFKPLPYFTGTAWQGASDWPNKELGWAQLTAVGGHPGNTRQQAVVRRWKADLAGKYDVHSVLVHQPEVGDGIRAFVSHSRLGKLSSVKIRASTSNLNHSEVAFAAGETLDFLVDINDGLNSDQFLWSAKIKPSGDSASGIWDAEKDFNDQARVQLSSWTQLIQVLMLSNEFMFVD
jgi:hypothetical protein